MPARQGDYVQGSVQSSDGSIVMADISSATSKHQNLGAHHLAFKDMRAGEVDINGDNGESQDAYAPHPPLPLIHAPRSGRTEGGGVRAAARVTARSLSEASQAAHVDKPARASARCRRFAGCTVGLHVQMRYCCGIFAH